MARMTKTQAKNLLDSIMSKAQRLAFSPQHRGVMTTQDFMAIEKICMKAMNRLK